MGLNKMRCNKEKWFWLAQDRVDWRQLARWFHKVGEFVSHFGDHQLLKLYCPCSFWVGFDTKQALKSKLRCLTGVVNRIMAVVLPKRQTDV